MDHAEAEIPEIFREAIKSLPPIGSVSEETIAYVTRGFPVNIGMCTIETACRDYYPLVVFITDTDHLLVGLEVPDDELEYPSQIATLSEVQRFAKEHPDRWVHVPRNGLNVVWQDSYAGEGQAMLRPTFKELEEQFEGNEESILLSSLCDAVGLHSFSIKIT